jgi:hypothetical protein
MKKVSLLIPKCVYDDLIKIQLEREIPSIPNTILYLVGYYNTYEDLKDK